MKTSEILDELPKLSRGDWEKIRLKLAELEGDGWADSDDPLTEDEKKLIAARAEGHERHPETSIPWEEFNEKLKGRLGE